MKSVDIIGLGAQTVVARTAAAAFASVGAGISRLTCHPIAVDRHGEMIAVAMASYLAEDLPVIDRMIELALPALGQAFSSSGHRRVASDELMIPLVLGLPSPRPGLQGSYDRAISMGLRHRLGEGSPVSSVQTILGGHTAGSMAIERAFEMIRDGLYPIVLAGGVDSYIDPDTLRWLDESGQLRADHNIDGFFPGEGAGFCLLASEDAGTVLDGVTRLGRLVAAATVGEEEEPRKLSEVPPVELIGETDGAAPRAPASIDEAWERVLGALPSEAVVSLTINDLNGQKQRSDWWSATFMAFHERFASALSFLSPALFMGDVGAASGPIFAAMMTAGFSNMSPRPRWGFLTTSTMSGPRSATLVASPGAVTEPLES